MAVLHRALGVLALAALAVLATALPVAAAEPKMPGGPAEKPFQRWSYPSQIPTGPIEDGSSAVRPTSNGFLTLPFMGPHYVTSIFDHCSPNYVPDGLVCRYDGVMRYAGGFDETGPPSKAWLFYDGHDGIDYGLYYENIIAAADGRVVYADWNRPGCATCGYGQEVRIDHGNGITTRYAHMSQILVANGQSVRRGQVIGISGNTGASTGEHLHWGVYRTDGFIAIDPYGWSGAEADPWPKDAGNLWLGGAPRFPDLAMPAVQVSINPLEGNRFTVGWKGVGTGQYDVQVVEDQRLGRLWQSAVGAGSAIFDAQPGHSYWFLVTVRNDLGWTATGGSEAIAVGAGLTS
jgi:murein DD-endopeptidase MepM/ murein hydrolase activator NlpD